MTKNEFYRNWLAHFAADISKQAIKKYVVATGNYLWHVFSWELLDDTKYLAGDAAKAAYDEVDKRGAIYIEWFEDKEAHALPEALRSAGALDELVEVYVVASDFSWTYIKTHEGMCGPYFIKS